MPQVEDLVYNYLGIPRKRTPKAEAAEKSKEDLLPIDLEAVSPASVKSNDGESKDSENKIQDMEIDSDGKPETNEEMSVDPNKDDLVEVSSDTASLDKSSIPLPTEEIKLENIPAPENSPKLAKVGLDNIELPIVLDKPNKVELKNIELPREPNLSTDIPLPDEMSVSKEDSFFKPLALQSEESNSSSGSSIRRNMSPLTPVRNFDDENSCDAQQAFENTLDENDHKEPSTFSFSIEAKESNNSSDVKVDKKETEQLSYQFNNQVNITTYNTQLYDDSSNSHNLQIDYESDANTNTSKTTEIKQDVENSEDSKKDRKDDRKSHKSSHRSRDSSRHSNSKDKHSSRDSSRHDKKPSSKDDKSKFSKERERSKDETEKKDSSKHKSSHKSSSSSKDKQRSSSSSHRHSSKSSDERKSSNNNKSLDKERGSDKDKSSRDKKDSKSSHRDKEKKSNKKDDKDKKKDKKDTDDHYSSSGRGNHSRRSTDRDSNDGSSSSKGSQSQNNSKSTEIKKESKSSNSKSDNTSTSGESTGQSDKEHTIQSKILQFKPIVRVDNLETPIANPPRLPFVPDVTLKKPKFANNFEEAKKMMKMRKFLAEEQKRMNQEAALLLEFQANVRPNLSQVYSSIPGPELEFACVTHNEIVPQEEPEVKDHVTESARIEVCDTKLPNTIVCILDEPLQMNQITKETKEIINDIIGVPVEEYHEEKSDDLIKNETLNVSNVTKDNEGVIIDTDVEDKPILQLVDEISEANKPERIQDSLEESLAEIVHDNSTEFEITVTAEALSETDVSEILEMSDETPKHPEKELQFFAEHEKFNAELERHKFSDFLEKFIESTSNSNKMYVINCDTYEESIVKEIASNFGDYEIVNFHKNGHILPNKNIVKDVSLTAEISLPLDPNYEERFPLFSPVKSECSFELSSDYDAKLDEIVNKKSRQEVMEIILGGILDEPSKMPTIDYYTELSDTEDPMTIVGVTETTLTVKSTENNLKRKVDEEVVVNNISVLTPNKIRKLSDSDQISSTTEGMFNLAITIFNPRCRGVS